MFSNVIVDIAFPRRSFVFSQSSCEVSASLTNVGGVAVGADNINWPPLRFWALALHESEFQVITQLITLNYPVILSHRHSTTVSQFLKKLSPFTHLQLYRHFAALMKTLHQWWNTNIETSSFHFYILVQHVISKLLQTYIFKQYAWIAVTQFTNLPSRGLDIFFS